MIVPTAKLPRYKTGAHFLIAHSPAKEAREMSVAAKVHSARPRDALKNENPQLTRVRPPSTKRIMQKTVIDRGLISSKPNAYDGAQNECRRQG